MKKLNILLLSIFLILTGCTKYENSMTINDDKSMDIKLTIAASDEAIKHKSDLNKKYNYLLDILESEEKDVQKKFKEYEVTKYSKDKYNGYTFTKHINNIDDVSTKKTITFNMIEELKGNKSDYYFNYLKHTYNTTYNANFIFDLSTDKEYAIYSDFMDFKFILQLPYKVKSNNANEVNNDTYTWNIKYGEFNKVDFTFNISNKINTVVGYIIALLLIIIIISILIKIRKGNNDDEDNIKFKVNLENVDTTKTLTEIANDTLKEEEKEDSE